MNTQADNLNCQLDVVPISLEGQPHPLQFTLTNQSKDELQILIWHTPLEGFWSDLFLITDLSTDRPLPYQGPMAKRGAPTEEDTLVLAPGQQQSATLDLTEAYALKAGHYKLQIRQKPTQPECYQQLATLSWQFEIRTSPHATAEHEY
ncbi:hypothetical protein P2G88_00025 [Aliiglaciecola sp. CAU 1673]|uniref:hypothetical protein n=1 Tax=Aliiglaciecola sp. CAU 1673 TaxID=3032595 RepID=UPI0023DC42A3|nr:hypothetical protein [Aliiglaciecola sp. CAU 1673]MDF2176632.1 hypothetical protein [Aliiglaciecola sp. CAU 1673]